MNRYKDARQNEDKNAKNSSLSPAAQIDQNMKGGNLPRQKPLYSAEARSQRVKQKNKKKAVRTVVQFVILLLMIFWVVQIVSNFDRYTMAADGPAQTDGFIAISYFGVERFDSGSNTLISQKRIGEHLDALRQMGYTTVTQQQVIDYYEKDEPLPEKALLLLFEDGRRDTAVYTHNILKRNQYIATCMTYANKLEKQDNKFLSSKDIKALAKTSYWEFGTNGYRLEYINVYDRYRNFFGQLDSDEFVRVAPYVGRDYNHYLMDFIRDEDRISTETYEQMYRRITSDYDSMKYIYEKETGAMPLLYALMHANTGSFGTDPYVSDVNQEHIENLFRLNINREGLCINTRASSIYDLTRMQPQPYWYSNHLVMRIADDTGHTPVFVIGDEQEAKKWQVEKGAAEFRGDAIVFTSNPNDVGRMRLLGMHKDELAISVELRGNVAGGQAIGLCENVNEGNSVRILLENNRLYIQQITSNVPVELYSLDLFEFDGGASQSKEENEKEGMLTYGNAILKNNKNYQRLQEGHSVLEEWEEKDVVTLNDGGEQYVPEIDLNDRDSRKLDITLESGVMTIMIDDRVAIRNLRVDASEGGIYLESSPLSSMEKYSQRNLTDDVYDAVFYNLKIGSPEWEVIHYEYTLSLFERIADRVSVFFSDIANFFIQTF